MGGTVSYLNEFREGWKVEAKTMEELREMDTLLSMFSHRSARMIFEVGKSFEEESKHMPFQEAWNYHLSDFIKINQAHASYLYLKSFVQDIKETKDESIKNVLLPLCFLFALTNVEDHLGEFIVDGMLSPLQAEMVSKAVKYLLTEIRPNAVPLVDAWAMSDHLLDSSLGRYDGNVYQDLFERAKQCSLNKKEVSDAYTLHLSKLIKGKIHSNL